MLFVLSGVSQYSGAAIAVLMFSYLPAVSVAWFRIAFSALVLLAWRRPWRHRWSRRELAASGIFGLLLASMNITFYIAISRLPLGTVVAIEFIGPVVVAAFTNHTARELWGALLAGVGVALLAGVELRGGLTESVVIGLVCTLAAAACWAGYILTGRRIAIQRDGINSLAVGMTIGALAFMPAGFGGARAWIHPGWLAALIGIAVLSSVIPYAIEQVVLTKLSPARFAVLLALLPVVAAATGAIVLGQIPGPMELGGVVLVCLAIMLATRQRDSQQPPLG